MTLNTTSQQIYNDYTKHLQTKLLTTNTKKHDSTLTLDELTDIVTKNNQQSTTNSDLTTRQQQVHTNKQYLTQQKYQYKLLHNWL